MASPKTTQPITSVAQWPPETLDQPLKEEDLRELSLALNPYRVKWNIIGLDLGLPQYQIDTIREDYRNTETRHTQMIHTWLLSGRNCTRRVLLDVLQKRGYISLAETEDARRINSDLVVKEISPTSERQSDNYRPEDHQMENSDTQESKNNSSETPPYSRERQSNIYWTENHQMDNSDTQESKYNSPETPPYSIEYVNVVIGKCTLKLASKITMAYSPENLLRSVEMSHLEAVREYLARYSAQWRDIGQYLGVSNETLDEINDKNNNDEKNLKQTMINCPNNLNCTVKMLLQVALKFFPKKTTLTIIIHPTKLVIEHKTINDLSPTDFWNAKCELRSIIQLLTVLANKGTLTTNVNYHLGLPDNLSYEIKEIVESCLLEKMVFGESPERLYNLAASFKRTQAPLLVLSTLLINDFNDSHYTHNMIKYGTGKSTECAAIDKMIREICFKTSLHNDAENCWRPVQISLKKTHRLKSTIVFYDRVTSIAIFSLFYSIAAKLTTAPYGITVISFSLIILLGLLTVHYDIKLSLYHCSRNLLHLMYNLFKWNYKMSLIFLGLIAGIEDGNNALGIPSISTFFRTILLTWIEHTNHSQTVTADIASKAYLGVKTLAFQILLGYLSYRTIKSRNLKKISFLACFIAITFIFQASLLTFTNILWGLAETIIILVLYKYKHITLPLSLAFVSSILLKYLINFTLGHFFGYDEQTRPHYTGYVMNYGHKTLLWIGAVAYIYYDHKPPWLLKVYGNINHTIQLLEEHEINILFAML